MTFTKEKHQPTCTASLLLDDGKCNCVGPNPATVTVHNQAAFFESMDEAQVKAEPEPPEPPEPPTRLSLYAIESGILDLQDAWDDAEAILDPADREAAQAAVRAAMQEYIGREIRLPERLRKRLTISQRGCWIWSGSLTPGGYGQIRIDNKAIVVHRVTYTYLRGPVPQGLDLDHLCRVRNCCNPSHLEPVTRSTNLRRGFGPILTRIRNLGRRKANCPRGHPYAGKNLYVTPKGDRRCRECKLILDRTIRAAALARKAETAVGIDG